MNTQDKIKVMQAYVDGKDIQIGNDHGGYSDWVLPSEPLWCWDTSDYRIKPKPVEGWVNLYPRGTYSTVYPTKPDALYNAGTSCICTVFMREVTE